MAGRFDAAISRSHRQLSPGQAVPGCHCSALTMIYASLAHRGLRRRWADPIRLLTPLHPKQAAHAETGHAIDAVGDGQLD